MPPATEPPGRTDRFTETTHFLFPPPATLRRDRGGGRTPPTVPGSVPGTPEFPRTYEVVPVIAHFTESISDDVSKVTWLSRDPESTYLIIASLQRKAVASSCLQAPTGGGSRGP